MNGTFYIGPTGNIVNDCTCSSVYYSLIGGCSACQSATIISYVSVCSLNFGRYSFNHFRWSDWTQNCTTNVTNVGKYVRVYSSCFISCSRVRLIFRFPEAIPADTAVPGWAYENVASNNTFNIQAVLADNSPESTAQSNAPSSTSSGSVTLSVTASVASTTTSSSSSSSSPSATSPSSSSSSHTGAIAGGVVGGLVGAAALGALAFLVGRRMRSGGAGSRSDRQADWRTAPVMGEASSKTYSPPPSAAHYDPVRLYVSARYLLLH